MNPLRPTNRWHDAFAFLLLINATLVILLVLVAARHYYDGFDIVGRVLAWLVVLGSGLVLGTLAHSLLRLYIRPAIANGQRRLKRNP